MSSQMDSFRVIFFLKVYCPQMHILSRNLMKNLEFQVFRLGNKAWTQSSKNEQCI